MNTPMKTMKRVLACLPLLSATVPIDCLAGSIQLTPVQINLSSGAKIAVLTVQNTGDEESVMQVTLKKWSLDGQHYVYEQSQDLVVTPATFRLAGGKQQIIRIGLRGNPSMERESSYRLLVEEVPPPPSSDVTQMRFAVRHDLPVFVIPDQGVRAVPVLEVAIDCAADVPRLRLTNVGNVHAKLRNVVLEDASVKKEVGRWQAVDYLLPDAQKSWDLPNIAPNAIGKSFNVIMDTEQGSFNTAVANTCH